MRPAPAFASGARGTRAAPAWAVCTWVVSVCVLGANVLGGCTSLSALARGAGDAMHPPALAANGLELTEQVRRDALAVGRWDTTRTDTALTAEERGEPGNDRPSDALLRDLDRGTAAYYAGRWRASVAAFARAAALADDRDTKRVSRGALALASNDRVLPYAPGQNERLFVHYYAALAYLRAGALEDAAVEARRLSLLLQRYDAERDSLDVGARTALRYIAGAIFEAAGAQNDADVAYRNAAALGGPAVAASAIAPTGTVPRVAALATAPGDVIVVIERGFVAHRIGQRLRVWTSRRGDAFASLDTVRQRVEVALHGNDAVWAGGRLPELHLTLPDDRATAPPTETIVPAMVPSDASSAPTAPPHEPERPARIPRMPLPLLPRPTSIASMPHDVPAGTPHAIVRRRERREESDDDEHWRLLTLAWPVYAHPPALGSLGGVMVDAMPLAAAPRTAPLLRGDLSLAVAADFKRDRAARLARLVVRAALRAQLVRSADRSDRTLGDLTAALGAAIERADTRSWHLLPADLQIVRLHLAPGTHTLTLDVDGQSVALGAVRVRPQTVQLVSARLWDTGEHGTDARITTAGLLAAAP